MSILKSHCFYVKMPMVFWDLIILHHTLSCEFRVHRAGSQLKMSERQTKAGNQDFCKTCTLSFTHSGHAEQLMFSSLCTKVTLTLFHSLSHSHTLSISHSLPLDMLNNFCFHLYAQKTLSHSLTLSLSLFLTLTLFQSLIHSLLT